MYALSNPIISFTFLPSLAFLPCSKMVILIHTCATLRSFSTSLVTFLNDMERQRVRLHAINEQVNNLYTGLLLDYQFNDDKDPNRFYYRSDHYNFAKNGIPSIFFFSGTHEDYHRTTDTVDKILFDKYSVICKLVFHNIWELANRKDRIVVDKPGQVVP